MGTNMREAERRPVSPNGGGRAARPRLALAECDCPPSAITRRIRSGGGPCLVTRSTRCGSHSRYPCSAAGDDVRCRRVMITRARVPAEQLVRHLDEILAASRAVLAALSLCPNGEKAATRSSARLPSVMSRKSPDSPVAGAVSANHGRGVAVQHGPVGQFGHIPADLGRVSVEMADPLRRTAGDSGSSARRTGPAWRHRVPGDLRRNLPQLDRPLVLEKLLAVLVHQQNAIRQGIHLGL